MLELNQVYCGDCLEVMKRIDSQSMNCCITSPPYYGLRNYGVDGQIGLEETPDQYVQNLVEVFREVKRVLRDDGTLWLNLGDSYNSHSCGKGNVGGIEGNRQNKQDNIANTHRGKLSVKNKDLIGIPWMVAFALRADGWYLRQDIIWHKPNHMPESVTDRCTKCHEYIFLLSKSAKYHYDYEAIMEKMECHERYNHRLIAPENARKGNGNNGKLEPSRLNPKTVEATRLNGLNTLKRNKRDVWTVTTKPFFEAHFATFPEDLILPCVKAGCPEGGIVLDPFMGAGTTAVVAKKQGGNFIGIELNPAYCEIARKRIAAVPPCLFEEKRNLKQGELDALHQRGARTAIWKRIDQLRSELMEQGGEG